MTLTQGLLGLAGSVLLVLALHGAWTAWRARPRRPEAATTSDLRLSREEPAGLDPSAEDNLEEARLRPASPRVRSMIDPLVDAVVEMSVEQVVSGDAVMLHWPATRRVGTKPMLIEGLPVDGHEWEIPQPGQRYQAFQAGVQLASRAGALNEIEYSEFVQKVQAFADALGATLDVPDMMDVVGRARELDAFASVHDAQLAVHVCAKAASWSVGYLTQMASRHGFVAAGLPGEWVLPGADAESPPLVILSFDPQVALAEEPNEAALRRFSLHLDVPQSPEAAEPFAQWQRVAAALMQDMDAVLVDDDGRPVNLHQFAAIHKDLLQLYQALDARDFPAGSPQARRLFS